MKKLSTFLFFLTVSFNVYSEETYSFHCIYTEQMHFLEDSIDSKYLTSGDINTTVKIFPESKYVIFDSSIFHKNRKANYIETGNSIKWAVGTLYDSDGYILKDFFELNRISGVLSWDSYSEKPDNEMKKFSNHRGNCKKLEPLF